MFVTKTLGFPCNLNLLPSWTINLCQYYALKLKRRDRILNTKWVIIFHEYLNITTKIRIFRE